MSNPKYYITIVILICSFRLTYAQEQESTIAINGYGGWAMAFTDGNTYLGGNEDGGFDELQFAINSTASPIERLTITGQINWYSQAQKFETEIAFAFAEWVFSERLKLRIGRVKHVFGIYSEIYSVGTIRPFFSLPQGIYGHSDIVAEGFNGIGFTGAHFFINSHWGIQYDAYWGQFDYKAFEIWDFFSIDEEDAKTVAAEEFVFERARSFGGRINIFSGIPGLKYGFSGYYGINDFGENEGETENTTRFVIGLHFEYLADKIWSRSEFARLSDQEADNKDLVNTAYAELGYKISPQIQLAAGFDFSEADKPEFVNTEFSSYLEHKDWAIGANYWFSPNFVVKSALHLVDGNRYALNKELLFNAESDDKLKETTRLFQLGAQFSF